MKFADELIHDLKSARSIAVLTGAGISAESGVPTFRDAQTGIWSNFNPEELATMQAFRRNPKLVWDWYAMRRSMMAGVKPNPGHTALVAMEKQIPEFTLITQNIDNLHQAAGSKNVVEIHGNLSRNRCASENMIVDMWKENGEAPPRCPKCGDYLRPDVVWFGELLPEDAMLKASDAASKCDVFFSIGTSGVVYPAADLPFAAARHGAIVIEINPEETSLSASAKYSLRGPSGVILPELIRATWQEVKP